MPTLKPFQLKRRERQPTASEINRASCELAEDLAEAAEIAGFTVTRDTIHLGYRVPVIIEKNGYLFAVRPISTRFFTTARMAEMTLLRDVVSKNLGREVQYVVYTDCPDPFTDPSLALAQKQGTALFSVGQDKMALHRLIAWLHKATA